MACKEVDLYQFKDEIVNVILICYLDKYLTYKLKLTHNDICEFLDK